MNKQRYSNDSANFSPYPQNPMIAHFFKEIDRVDELGSGVRNTYLYCDLYTPGTKPEFLECDVFKAMNPIQIKQATGQPTEQVSGEAAGEVQKLINILKGKMKRSELQKKLGFKHNDYFRLYYIESAMKAGFIGMIYSDSPNHPNQSKNL